MFAVSELCYLQEFQVEMLIYFIYAPLNFIDSHFTNELVYHFHKFIGFILFLTILSTIKKLFIIIVMIRTMIVYYAHLTVIFQVISQKAIFCLNFSIVISKYSVNHQTPTLLFILFRLPI